MRKDTTNHYIHAHTCLLAFLLRAKSGIVAGYSLPQPGYIFDAAGELLLHLASKDKSRIIRGVHKMTMSILKEPQMLPTGNSASPITLYLAYQNTMPSGGIKHPEDINGTLTDFKWPVRATVFRDIVDAVEQQYSVDEEERFSYSVDDEGHPITR